MPMYDYKCNSCEHVFEKNVKIADGQNSQECPECKENDSTKFIGGAPLFGDPDRMFAQKKTPEGWKEILRRIDKESPGSRLKETSTIDFGSKQ